MYYPLISIDGHGEFFTTLNIRARALMTLLQAYGTASEPLNVSWTAYLTLHFVLSRQRFVDLREEVPNQRIGACVSTDVEK